MISSIFYERFAWEASKDSGQHLAGDCQTMHSMHFPVFLDFGLLELYAKEIVFNVKREDSIRLLQPKI